MQNDEGSAYLDLALRNAQAVRDLERNTAPHPPRPQAVRLPRELEWPKVEDKLKYRHSDKRTPIEFRRALEMLTNHVGEIEYRLTLACQYEGTLQLFNYVHAYAYTVYTEVYRIRVYIRAEATWQANSHRLECSSGRSCQRDPGPRKDYK